ncbi:MAG: hypothetical protein M3R70_06050 [Actinomycetota bacterium]|nr:hypothetical protein [Actinomycetota bacterium]
MQRSAVALTIQRCDNCGYCSGDIETAPVGAREIVENETYRARLTAPGAPEATNRYLCAALVLEAAEEFREAGWNAVEAAWVADDEDAEGAAIEARERAIDLFRRASLGATDDVADHHAVVADLLRRTGRMDESRETCMVGLDSNPDALVRGVLEYELTLLDRNDRDAHSSAEAVAG